MPSSHRIAVIGLGYVGLPLAVALARHFPVTGYDRDGERVAQLTTGHDRTGEVAERVLGSSSAAFTDRAEDMARCTVFIVAVPTPVDAANRPDLAPLDDACRTVGGCLKKGDIVVFESTVYPGVTEDVCGARLESVSGLGGGVDFHLGYSPERINPGDRDHAVERITKVVAGQTPEVVAVLKDIYGAVTSGGVFVARDIRTAEAAKVIENAQRDINIAFINEVAMIFKHLGLSTHDVLEAAATKWNFLDFQPGLVGGHCIGIDPYYLAHCAQQAGHHPEVILAGRRINDAMGSFVADQIHRALAPGAGTRTLVLGLTFKENVSDLRNSKVVDVVRGLESLGHRVDVHDPLADPDDAERLYDIRLLADLDGAQGYDCVVGAVAHETYRAFTAETFAGLLAGGGLVADIKGLWRRLAFPQGVRVWRL